MSVLYIMCGIPASGKSTLVKKLPLSMMANEKLNIVESDVGRKILLTEYGFPNAVHQNTISDELMPVKDKKKLEAKVWEGIERVVIKTLGSNEDIVIDATNTEQKVLDDWFTFATKHGYKVKVIIMSTPLDICIKRNNARETPAPKDVMSYMYNSYIMTIGWLYMNHNEKIINSTHLL